jgi:hypothetical protein
MGEQRVIAEVRDYNGFTAGLRAWIAELGTTYESVNDLVGLAPNYLAKMISRSPTRSFSRMSLGNTLAGLGLKILLVVDAEKLAEMRPRYAVRKKQKHTSAAIPAQKSTPLRGNPELARFYAHRRVLLQSPQRRRAIARRAIRIRWRRAKAAPENAPVR